MRASGIAFAFYIGFASAIPFGSHVFPGKFKFGNGPHIFSIGKKDYLFNGKHGSFGTSYNFENSPVFSRNSLAIRIHPDTYLPKKELQMPSYILPQIIQGKQLEKQTNSDWNHPFTVTDLMHNVNYNKPNQLHKPIPVLQMVSNKPVLLNGPRFSVSKIFNKVPSVDRGTIVIDKPFHPRMTSSNILPSSDANVILPTASSNVVPFVGVVANMGIDDKFLHGSQAPQLQHPSPVPIPAPPVVRENQASFEGRFSSGLESNNPEIRVNAIGSNPGINHGRVNEAVLLNQHPVSLPNQFDTANIVGHSFLDNNLGNHVVIGNAQFSTNNLEPHFGVTNLDSHFGPNNLNLHSGSGTPDVRLNPDSIEARFGINRLGMQTGSSNLQSQFEPNIDRQFRQVIDLSEQPFSGRSEVPIAGSAEQNTNFGPTFPTGNTFPQQTGLPIQQLIGPSSFFPFFQDNNVINGVENNILDPGHFIDNQFNAIGGNSGNFGSNVGPSIFSSLVNDPQMFDGPGVSGIAGNTLNINSVIGDFKTV